MGSSSQRQLSRKRKAVFAVETSPVCGDVAGCKAHGQGSMMLQVRKDRDDTGASIHR